ncbi:hypothetical protein SDC9_202171 [bioreactor metagenome]|uniref:Uncharacterized protein n=1 Tax=bioreactor metagenome TaxID=1076179 RepID=A0A645ISZ0_9ZZZZ
MIFGSTLIIKVMDRFPIIVTLGAALIGWVAGETIASDEVLSAVVASHPWLPHAASVLGAVLVVLAGTLLQRRAEQSTTTV